MSNCTWELYIFGGVGVCVLLGSVCYRLRNANEFVLKNEMTAKSELRQGMTMIKEFSTKFDQHVSC